MSSNFIVVEVEVGEVFEALRGTSKSLKSIQKQSLGIIARKGLKALKMRIKETIRHPERSTGELQRAYRYKVRKDGSEVNIFPKAKGGSRIFPKAFMQNYGYEKPKAFVQYAENVIKNHDYENDLQKMVDKTLEKYWG